MLAEQKLQLREHPEERVSGRHLGGVAVAGAAGFEERVGTASQVRERGGVAAEEEDVALDADPLVFECPREPRTLRAPVASVPQRSEGGDVRPEVAVLEGLLHLRARPDHLAERRFGALLGTLPREERLEAEAERLDLLELLQAQGCDPGAAASRDYDEALALQPTQGVPDGGRADVEAGCELFQREPEPRRELETADLRPERPVDDVLGRDDLELERSLIFDQKLDASTVRARDPARAGERHARHRGRLDREGDEVLGLEVVQMRLSTGARERLRLERQHAQVVGDPPAAEHRIEAR